MQVQELFGGCRARADSYFGVVNAGDPGCIFNERHWISWSSKAWRQSGGAGRAGGSRVRWLHDELDERAVAVGPGLRSWSRQRDGANPGIRLHPQGVVLVMGWIIRTRASALVSGCRPGSVVWCSAMTGPRGTPPGEAAAAGGPCSDR